MTNLIELRNRPPRWEQNVRRWSRIRSTGLLIDWLDSRPEHTDSDNVALGRAISKGDLVAWAAAVTTGRFPAPESPVDEFEGGYLLASAAYQQGDIAAWLDADELAFGEHTYRRLHEVLPGCMSGLVNLAELERRAGREAAAHRLLEDALARATAAITERHGAPDSRWELQIRCALARLDRNAGDGAPLLEIARPERLNDLTALLRSWDSKNSAAIAVNRAFSVASPEQQMVLYAAMREAEGFSTPPRSAYFNYKAVLAFYDKVQEQRMMKRGTPPPNDGERSSSYKWYAWLSIAAPFVLLVRAAIWFAGAWEPYSPKQEDES